MKETRLHIFGDFNLTDIDWVHELSPLNPNSISFLFVECLRDCFLTQHITQLTHKRGDQQANILDLILTNEDNMIEDLRYEAPLGKIHHCSLVFKFRCYAEYKSSNVKTFKCAMVDYEKLRALVTECDLSVVEDMPMEEGWRYLEENITMSMSTSIPKSMRNMLRLGTKNAGSVVRQRRYLNAHWHNRVNGTLMLCSAMSIAN